MALRFGVVGTGMMGCEHLRNVLALPDATVTAVADPNEAPRSWAEATVGAAADLALFDDHRALLASGLVDAVIVASPNHTHAAVLDDVWPSGLPVLVEKPVCTTVADAQRVVAAAATHPAPVWVGLEYRYMPTVARFLREVPDAVGTVRMISVREHRFPFLPKVDDWNRFTRNTGGSLVEKCCHFFDLMDLAVGARPARVYASGGQDVNHLDEVYDGEVPDILDNAFVVVDYENGARGCLDLCMFAEAGRDEQELVAVGERGKVEAGVPSGTVFVSDRATRARREIDASADPRIRYEGFHHGASYLEVVGFAAAVRGEGPVDVTAEDGLWSVAVGVAAHRSIDEGRPVSLAELGLG